MEKPFFDLRPEDAANIPSIILERSKLAAQNIVNYLAEHPEKIPDYVNSLKIPPYAPTEEKKPAPPAISETRRRAARARWDAPREKSTRVTVTLPPDVAKKLHAAADASHRPVSHLVAKCVANALPALLLDALAVNLED